MVFDEVLSTINNCFRSLCGVLHLERRADVCINTRTPQCKQLRWLHIVHVWRVVTHNQGNTCTRGADRIVVSTTTSTWHGVQGSIPGPRMLYFRCKNLALNIRDCISRFVGCGSSVGLAPLQNLGKFVYPTLPVSHYEPLLPSIWRLCQRK